MNEGRDNVRVAHLGYVLMFMLVIIVLALGVYEALAALTYPEASAVLPLFQSLRGGSPSALPTPVP